MDPLVVGILGNPDTFDWEPRLSPDGREVVFQRTYPADDWRRRCSSAISPPAGNAWSPRMTGRSSILTRARTDLDRLQPHRVPLVRTDRARAMRIRAPSLRCSTLAMPHSMASSLCTRPTARASPSAASRGYARWTPTARTSWSWPRPSMPPRSNNSTGVSGRRATDRACRYPDVRRRRNLHLPPRHPSGDAGIRHGAMSGPVPGRSTTGRAQVTTLGRWVTSEPTAERRPRLVWTSRGHRRRLGGPAPARPRW